MQAAEPVDIRPPPSYPLRPTTESTTSILKLPREIRNDVYSLVIASAEMDAYNRCGIGLAYDLTSYLLVCKQIASELMDALLLETRVALQVNLSKRKLLDVVNTVSKGVRKQARALAIDVGEKSRPLFIEQDAQDFPLDTVVEAVIHAVNSFPSVRDVAISIQLRNTANMGLVALLEKELEQLSELEEYRIYTHAFPSGRSNQDWVCGRCTITWVIRTLYGGKLQWKARVIDTTQWGTMYPVWLLYGED
jgi:hypothetical protein